MVQQVLYVGTYTDTQAHVSGKGKGIEIFTLDFDEQKKHIGLTHVKSVKAGVSPSWLCLTTDNKYLYAANEVGAGPGEAHAFRVSEDGLDLVEIDAQPSSGVGPAHVTCSADNNFMYLANYWSGNVIEYTIGQGGKLDSKQNIQYQGGSKVVKDRQMESHAHCFVFHPNGKYAYSCDLGDDTVWVYKYDATNGITLLGKEVAGSAGPGHGVRHIVFNTAGTKAYVSLELLNGVSVYDVDVATGKLTKKQTLSTLPPDFDKWNGVSDIHITPDDKFVYVANRGHDSIAMYSVGGDGLLTLIGIEPARVHIPRGFTVDPTGSVLLVGGQDSHNISAFWVDKSTGKLTYSALFDCNSAVCLRIVEY